MERAIKFLVISFIALFSSLAQAREGDCIYALGNGMNAYCSFVTAPDDMKRYLEVVYSPDMAITSCVDNTTLPFSFSEEMIGENNLVSFGNHTVNFYQCKTVECTHKKLVGTSTFTVNADKTVNPNKFNIPLDPTFGGNCAMEKFNPNNAAMIIPKVICKKAAPFCASLILPNDTHKFIKVVNDQEAAFTYCITNQHAIALSKNVNAGTHSFTIYQCDSLLCEKQKFITQEVLTISPEGKFDHSAVTLTLDPTFGENCFPNNQ